MVGKLLKDLRVDNMLTLKDVAVLTGFSQVYLSEIERGNKTPKNGNSLKKLSIGYNIPFDDLLNALMQEIKQEAKSDN